MPLGQDILSDAMNFPPPILLLAMWPAPTPISYPNAQGLGRKEERVFKKDPKSGLDNAFHNANR